MKKNRQATSVQWKRAVRPKRNVGFVTVDEGGRTYSVPAGGAWLNGKYVEWAAKIGIKPGPYPAITYLPVHDTLEDAMAAHIETMPGPS